MSISLKGLDHVVLISPEPARLIAFYVEVLGCAVERQVESIGLTQLRAGASLIDILQRPADASSEGAPNMDHFCVRVEPWDEVAIRAVLHANEVEASETATRYGAEGHGPSIYLNDPDGNVVELKGPAV